MSSALYDLRRLIRQLSGDELVIATAYVRNIINARAKADEVKAWNEWVAKMNGLLNPEDSMVGAVPAKDWVDNVSAFTPKPKTGIEIAMDLES